MKAVRFSRFGGPEVLEIADLPDPHPGPGQVRIAVRAAGVNPKDWKKRKGLMDRQLPQALGHEAAGVVDELGEGVADVAVGDRVFGFSAGGAAQAELAVLSFYAPIPPLPDFPAAAALPAAIETATRALGQLGIGIGIGSGGTLLISGASGRAVHALAEIGELIESGRFSLPVAQAFPLARVAEAHRVSEDGQVRGKLVLVVGSPEDPGATL